MKKFHKLFVFLFALIMSIPVFAETERALLLAQETEDFTKCADVALENFEFDHEAQTTITILFRALLLRLSKS